MLSQEYVGAIVLVIVSILKAFGIELANDAVQGIVMGLIAVWIAIRRYQKKDITLLGVRK